VKNDTFMPFVMSMERKEIIEILRNVRGLWRRLLSYNILYLWTTAFISLLVISYHDFLFFFFLLVRWLILYTSCVRTLYTFNDI
jgi:hypothetical protein